jgi:hypothetical protein
MLLIILLTSKYNSYELIFLLYFLVSQYAWEGQPHGWPTLISDHISLTICAWQASELAMSSLMHATSISLFLSLISCSTNEVQWTLTSPASLPPLASPPTVPNPSIYLSLPSALDGR